MREHTGLARAGARDRRAAALPCGAPRRAARRSGGRGDRLAPQPRARTTSHRCYPALRVDSGRRSEQQSRAIVRPGALRLSGPACLSYSVLAAGANPRVAAGYARRRDSRDLPGRCAIRSGAAGPRLSRVRVHGGIGATQHAVEPAGSAAALMVRRARGGARRHDEYRPRRRDLRAGCGVARPPGAP